MLKVQTAARWKRKTSAFSKSRQEGSRLNKYGGGIARNAHQSVAPIHPRYRETLSKNDDAATPISKYCFALFAFAQIRGQVCWLQAVHIRYEPHGVHCISLFTSMSRMPEMLRLRFSYLIAEDVCYLSLCEPSFPKKILFAYLEDLHREFSDQYGRKISTVTRPYSFIEFGKSCFRCTLGCLLTLQLFLPQDTYIQKTKKSYIDSRARRNLGSINTELQDVQKIMVANIEEVLQRGEALSGKLGFFFFPF